jgi:hypothetical protein
VSGGTAEKIQAVNAGWYVCRQPRHCGWRPAPGQRGLGDAAAAPYSSSSSADDGGGVERGGDETCRIAAGAAPRWTSSRAVPRPQPADPRRSTLATNPITLFRRTMGDHPSPEPWDPGRS